MKSIKIPFPPTTNNLFLNVKGKGRVPTPEYRAWRQHASLVVASQRPMQITKRVCVHVDLDQRRQGDADNRLKAPLDLLVSCGVLIGDSKNHVKRASVGWEEIDECQIRFEEA